MKATKRMPTTSVKNTGKAAGELHQARNDFPEQIGNATPESAARMVSAIGTVVPMAMAHVAQVRKLSILMMCTKYYFFISPES